MTKWGRKKSISRSCAPCTCGINASLHVTLTLLILECLLNTESGRSGVSNYRSGVDNWLHVVERRMSAAVWCQD